MQAVCGVLYAKKKQNENDDIAEQGDTDGNEDESDIEELSDAESVIDVDQEGSGEESSESEDSLAEDVDSEEEEEDYDEVHLTKERATAIAKVRKIYKLFKKSPKSNDKLQDLIKKVN